MKKKINKMMILIATVTILLTMVLITVVYYDLIQTGAGGSEKLWFPVKKLFFGRRDQGKRSAGGIGSAIDADRQ